MKSLTEYISESELNTKRIYGGYKLPNKYNGHRTFEEFLDLNNIYIIDDKDISYYYKFNFNNINERSHDSYIWNINETLKSHPHIKLIDKINKTFKDKIENIYCISNKDADALPIVIQIKSNNAFVSRFQTGSNKLAKTHSSELLYDIIEFFNYYISTIEKSEEVDGYDIFLEPEYTKDISKEIKKNGGHIYHITSIDNLDIIKRTGLRPRVGKTRKLSETDGYRYFVERIFFIGDNESKEKTIENIKSVIADKQFTLGKYVILDIDILQHNIGLWEDGASEGKYNVYTYEAIPPYLIKRYVKDVNDL